MPQAASLKNSGHFSFSNANPLRRALRWENGGKRAPLTLGSDFVFSINKHAPLRFCSFRKRREGVRQARQDNPAKA